MAGEREAVRATSPTLNPSPTPSPYPKQVWGRGFETDNVLAVCSDADGAAFTTSPDDVERFLAAAAADSAAPALMVGTYASYARVA